MKAVKKKILESEIKIYPLKLEGDSVENAETRNLHIIRISEETNSVEFKNERFARFRKSLRKRSASIL